MSIEILVVTPDLNVLGGVANHYLGLKKYWTENVRYITYGKRTHLPAFLLLPFDVLNYITQLIFKKPEVVIINPSLRPYQLIRDGFYLIVARIFRVRVITFFHGWDDNLALKLIKNPGIFKTIFGSSEFVYVLCENFKIQLIEMGIKCPIYLTTTKVDDKMLIDFDINKKNTEINNILFLARVEVKKGIYITIDAFQNITNTRKNLTLTIVGSGGALEEAKAYVSKKGIKNIHFKGALHGKELIMEYKKASLYILPTHSEGMPTSVLEAMAFGLPVITRPVGGLNDFFQVEKMGTLIESLDPLEYASAIRILINDEEKCQEIGIYNHNYAIRNFLASKVTRKIEADIDLLAGKNRYSNN